MQDNSLESSSSLSQLRESYLPESRVHPRHCEINLSDGGQQHRRYGTVTGKSEDLGAQDEFPDLSAFLSQEELDKSVNLARQAIGQGPQEEKGEEKPLSVHSWKIPASSEKKEVSQTQPMTPDRQTFQTSSKENNIMRNNRTQKDPGQDVRKPVRNTPYGPEAQSKKEFLNKAADFIEELSSLFKANSSKRIRPRACKTHRSRYQAKAQSDVAAFAVSTEGRERPTYNEQLALQTGPHLEEAAESPSPHGPKGDLCDAGQPESCETTDASPSAPPPAERCVVEPPRFLRKLKSREVPEGSKVQLDCVVRGCPTPEVRWFCEGKELESSPDILIVSDGELHSLTITEAFEEDTGRYSCFASNFYGTDSTSAEIYIEGASSTDSDGDQHCEHVAQPQKKPSTSVPVVPRPPPVCEEDPPSVSPSTAPPITVQDVSSPPAAQMVNPQTLLQEDQNAVNCPQGLDGRLLMAAPVFTKNLQDITATEGQLVVLECRVKGVPSPRVEWYREGSMVDDSPDFRILQKKPRSMAESEEICTLVIAEVFPEDSGMFTCTAKNKYGTQSSIAYLRVKGHEDNSSTTKAVTSLLAESSQHVQIDPKSPDPSSRMVLGHMTQSNSSPGDGLTFNAKPFHQSEPHPGNTITEPLASSLKSKLEDFHVLYNKPLPKLEDINVSHKKPLPQLEDVNVGHNQPFPWLEGSHAHHNEPLPRAEGGFLHHHNSRPNYFSPDTFSQEALAKPSDPFSSSLPPSSVTLGLRPKPEGPKPEGPKLEGPQASPVAPRLSTVPRDPGVPPKAKAQAQGAPSEQGEARPAPSASDTPSSCLKPRLVNQSEARTNSRVGLRVHFKLPEDELESTSLEDAGATVETWEDPALTAPRKEPPAVLAKPRL